MAEGGGTADFLVGVAAVIRGRLGGSACCRRTGCGGVGWAGSIGAGTGPGAAGDGLGMCVKVRMIAWPQ